MATVLFPHCVFRFFKLFLEQEELFDILCASIFSVLQFLLFVAFALLRTNIRLRALSAVMRTYLRLEKMAYFREVKMNYIFKTQYHMVVALAESVLLKIMIIFIDKTGIQLNLHENMF